MYCFIFIKCIPTENTKGNQTIRVHFFVTSFYSATGASSSDFSAIEAKRRPVYLPSALWESRSVRGRPSQMAFLASGEEWSQRRKTHASQRRKERPQTGKTCALLACFLACFSFLPLKEGRSRSSKLSSFNSHHLRQD